MTLEELNNLENQAKKLEYEADREKGSQEIFAKLRTGGEPLYVELAHKNTLRYREYDHSFIQGVINELGPEILRIAEMRKAAREREIRTKARAIRESIKAFLGETEAA